MDKLIRLVSKTGKILLESGAEVYRVEETVVRIANAYNVDDASCFVLPTGVFASFVYDNKAYSLVSRVTNRSTDLNKVDLINNLSRSLCDNPISLDEYEIKLKEIENAPFYSMKVNMLSAAVGCVGFGLIFKGSLIDGLACFFIGPIIKLTNIYFSKKQLSPFFSNFICGGLIGIFSIALSNMITGLHIDKVIIGCLMLLVPGLLITNAIRDSLAGDLVSGLSRAFEAILIAVAIACGVGCILYFALLGGLTI